jgi:hypothetical protein
MFSFSPEGAMRGSVVKIETVLAGTGAVFPALAKCPISMRHP